MQNSYSQISGHQRITTDRKFRKRSTRPYHSPHIQRACKFRQSISPKENAPSYALFGQPRKGRPALLHGFQNSSERLLSVHAFSLPQHLPAWKVLISCNLNVSSGGKREL